MTDTVQADAVQAAAAQVAAAAATEAYPRIVAALIRITGDWTLAEETEHPVHRTVDLRERGAIMRIAHRIVVAPAADDHIPATDPNHRHLHRTVKDPDSRGNGRLVLSHVHPGDGTART